MPSMNDVKQQLREWEQSHTTVMLSFSESRQFWLHLCGRIGCGMNCGYFELMADNGARFASPLLSAFKVVSLGPDPNLGNHTTITLKHRRRRWEIRLTDTGAAEPTLEEIEAAAEAYVASRQRRIQRKPYVH